MAISNAQPIHFNPKGLVDAFDATEKFVGACRALTNLVFDQSNPELVTSRPGITLLADLKTLGYSNPTFISVQVSIGSRVYGMVATSRYPGHDEPFIYDTATGGGVPISGTTSLNTPLSPSTAGEWTPPTIDVVGTMVIVTHPGFSGTGKWLWGGGALWGTVALGGTGALWGDYYHFGIIDISNPTSPTWNATTTAVNKLTGVPIAVANFNNRAYFSVSNIAFYTDVLTNPPTITTASQQVTVGDSAPINAMVGLPVQTTGSGVVQTMTVFKKTQTWQLGGDSATFNLSLSFTSLTVGTNAPRSVKQAPFGLYFTSSGGPYFIDLLGTLRPLTHDLQQQDPDVVAPFQNAVTPSRWAGGYTATVYRVCGPTVIQGLQSVNDYWFDEHRRRWNGPHSFAYDCCSSLGDFFVLTSVNNPGLLMQAYPHQSTTLITTDMGTQNSFKLRSSTFPKKDWMAMKQVVESQIELAATGGGITYQVVAQDEQGNVLGTVAIAVAGGGQVWGNFVWGDGTVWGYSELWGGGALWGSTAQGGSNGIWGAGAQAIPSTYPVAWTAPLVFEKMQLIVSGSALGAAEIGTFFARYQKTGYMTHGPVGP